MKRIHRTLVTALVVAGAGGGAAAYVYFGEVRHEDERRQAELEGRRLFHVEPSQVTGGVLHARGATISFARDEVFGWRITTPVDTPADATAIDALVERVSKLEVEEVDTGAVTSEVLGRYEVARPKVWVELTAGSEPAALLVGPKNTLDGRYFVTDAARKAIYLADPRFFWAVDRGLESLRDPRVFPLSQSQILGISVSTPSGLLFHVARGEPKKADPAAKKAANEAAGWTVTDEKGPPLPADEGEVNFLLVLLTGRLKVEHWLTDTLRPDAPQALEAYGFKPFDLLVDVEFASGARSEAQPSGDRRPDSRGQDGASRRGQDVQEAGLRPVPGEFTSGHRRVRLGWHHETASDRVTPVMWTEGTTTLVSVPEWVKKDLAKPVDVLRDRVLSYFDATHARRLELTRGPVKVTFDRDEATWRLAAGAAPSPTELDAMLRVASRLRATRVEVEHPTDEQRRTFGLGRATIRVSGENGEVLTELELGKAASDTEIYLYAKGRDRVGRYAKKLAELLTALTGK